MPSYPRSLASEVISSQSERGQAIVENAIFIWIPPSYDGVDF